MADTGVVAVALDCSVSDQSKSGNKTTLPLTQGSLKKICNTILNKENKDVQACGADKTNMKKKNLVSLLLKKLTLLILKQINRKVFRRV